MKPTLHARCTWRGSACTIFQRGVLLLGIVPLLFLCSSAPAIEPWADDKLPVQDSLELWLDAARENFAVSDVRMIPHGGPLDIWHDASGNKRHLHQPVPELRPHWFREAGGAFIRFNGTNQFLSGAGFNFTTNTLTVIIRATPRSNRGGFRAFLGANESSGNDYGTGINIDFGPGSTQQLDSVNIEGCGFTGVENLLKANSPFGAAHTFTILSRDGTNGIQLWFDGEKQGARNRVCEKIRLHEIAVGARFYSNTPEPPHVQGFLDGDISDVLIFSRALTDAEREKVETYLAAKNAPQLGGRKFSVLQTISNAPPVQMFVPGFRVRELPVQLSNINNVKYRADGRLVALGYDGRLWLLSDTNGDGLEDRAQIFWDKSPIQQSIGMALTPPGYPRGDGAFLASKGKIVLIVDTNHDDVADQEIIVAKDYTPADFPHGVDTLGVALDKDGSLYFGIGTANFAGAYRIDPKTGKSMYSLKSDRGTIQKVSADFGHREMVCTGIRFPVAMAFNDLGDLFCTDQEGATWLPNGNPFDELLQIEPNRHYGFPPRHPKHLPNVIDEPSVFDYGPQHQSTCGLNFNKFAGGKDQKELWFGPDWWKGDVFVSGYSRGKLWRTKLVKTSVGYVAQSQLLASLNMLTVDACTSPQGDLVVSTHSGLPDWGSGPTGMGKLWKIDYAERDMPQPVLTWPASSTETAVEFDRPLNPAWVQRNAKKMRIEQGRYVSAGDEFEILRPGYQAVRNQLAEPRYELDIKSVQLSSDARTLIIRTPARAQAVNYALTLPREAKQTDLTQFPRIDLAHDLCGVEAEWISSDKKESWTGWLPHVDTKVAAAFTKSSARHDLLWNTLAKPGDLTLRAQLDLWQMLRAATQPISKLDFQYPDESVTLVFKAVVTLQVKSSAAQINQINEHEARLTVTPKQNQWIPIELRMTTGAASEPAVEVSWFTAEDSRPRALPLRRLLMPWAIPGDTLPNEQKKEIPEIAGGNWLRGKKIFFGDKVACFKCHTVRGEGGHVGPDLSNLVERDYASVLKDITQPSAAINPDHIAYNIEFKDADAITAIPAGETNGEVFFLDASANKIGFAKDKIVSMKPSMLSLMPEGLLNGLNELQVKDLLTFLLTSPLEPASISIHGEPPARSRAEVEGLLQRNSTAPLTDVKPLRIILCTGPKDHGTDEHDYPLWQKRWSKLLALADAVTVETANDWPTQAQLTSADIVIFYSNNPGWSAKRAPELDAFLGRGGGLVYIHYAVDGHENFKELAQRIGLAWHGGACKFRHGPVDLALQPHEITRGFEKVSLVDETYWQLIGDKSNYQLLASGVEENVPQPQVWVREQGRGRVFVSIPGHYTWTFDDPLFRLLLLRGIAWTAHQSVDRFNDLALIGARVAN